MHDTRPGAGWIVQKPLAGPLTLAVLALALAVVPLLAGEDNLPLMVEMFAMIAMAQAWNLLAGYTGFVSVGQQAFVGIGAYAMFLLAIKAGINPFVAVVLGGAVAAAVGAAAAPALFHLRGPTFAIGTWVLAELFRILLTNTAWFGGASGLTLARVVSDTPLQTRVRLTYWLALALAVLSTGAIYALLRSRFGLAIRTVRDNEPSAESVGVNVRGVKLTVFVIASFITGCAGAVAYLNTMFVSTGAAFAVEWSALIIFVVIIGGLGTLEGPIIGTLVFFALRETLGDYGTWYVITLGCIAIAAMLFAPEGLWGKLSRRLGLRLFPATATVVRLHGAPAGKPGPVHP